MHSWVLNEIVTHWGMSSWDQYASQTNKKFTHCCSRAALGRNYRDNALLLCWLDHLRYAFHSSPLLPQVLQEICHNKAWVIFIRPSWPRLFFGSETTCKCQSYLPSPSDLSHICWPKKVARSDTTTQILSTLQPNIWMGVRSRPFIFRDCSICSQTKQKRFNQEMLFG